MAEVKVITNKLSSGKIEEDGDRYSAIVEVAMRIADERAKQLDEIERLLDAGENDAAITLMREYIGSKPPKKKAPNREGLCERQVRAKI